MVCPVIGVGMINSVPDALFEEAVEDSVSNAVGHNQLTKEEQFTQYEMVARVTGLNVFTDDIRERFLLKKATLLGVGYVV